MFRKVNGNGTSVSMRRGERNFFALEHFPLPNIPTFSCVAVRVSMTSYSIFRRKLVGDIFHDSVENLMNKYDHISLFILPVFIFCMLFFPFALAFFGFLVRFSRVNLSSPLLAGFTLNSILYAGLSVWVTVSLHSNKNSRILITCGGTGLCANVALITHEFQHSFRIHFMLNLFKRKFHEA